jgi:hypothetical protein
MSVTNSSITNKALSNKIEFITTSSQNAQIYRYGTQNGGFDISGTLLSGLTIDSNNITYIDYDISMNHNYKYQLRFAENNYNVYGYSFNGRIQNGTIDYKYEDDRFSLTWDNPHNQENLDNYSKYIYDIFIKANPIPTNNWPGDGIVHFQTQPPMVGNRVNGSVEFDIKSDDTKDSSDQSRIFVKDTKYSFYISPRYSLPNQPDNFTHGYSKIRLPRYIGRYNLSPPIITNFKESSPYNNNKISFSWDNIVQDKFLTYGVMLRKQNNDTYNLVEGFPENRTINNYTLNNSMFKYSPGDYSIDISANFSSYIHTKSETLYFNIPVTPIDLTVILENENIKLNWTNIQYAKYYKITVKRINKHGNLESELYFYTGNKSENFPIDSTDQVQLKFSVSYSEEGTPPSNRNIIEWPYGKNTQQLKQPTQQLKRPTQTLSTEVTYGLTEGKLNI